MGAGHHPPPSVRSITGANGCSATSFVVGDEAGERLEVEYTDDEGGAATTTLAVVDGFLAPRDAQPPLALFERQR